MIERVKYIGLIGESGIVKEDIVITGGLMALLGLRVNNDLDILVRDVEFSRLNRDSRFEHTSDKYGKPHLIYGKLDAALLIGPDIGFTKNEVFKYAEEIQGFKFIPLGIFLGWKLKVGRAKDLNDIKLIWDKLLPEEGA